MHMYHRQGLDNLSMICYNELSIGEENMQTQNVIRSYEPTPHNGRNSFYGKCKIIETADGCRYLRSYATIVAYIDSTGKAHRT